jgi:hypothetical protein
MAKNANTLAMSVLPLPATLHALYGLSSNSLGLLDAKATFLYVYTVTTTALPAILPHLSSNPRFAWLWPTCTNTNPLNAAPIFADGRLICVGACVILHGMGFTDTQIQFLLCWQSNALYVYLRNIAGLAHKQTARSTIYLFCPTSFKSTSHFGHFRFGLGNLFFSSSFRSPAPDDMAYFFCSSPTGSFGSA